MVIRLFPSLLNILVILFLFVGLNVQANKCESVFQRFSFLTTKINSIEEIQQWLDIHFPGYKVSENSSELWRDLPKYVVVIVSPNGQQVAEFKFRVETDSMRIPQIQRENLSAEQVKERLLFFDYIKISPLVKRRGLSAVLTSYAINKGVGQGIKRIYAAYGMDNLYAFLGGFNRTGSIKEGVLNSPSGKVFGRLGFFVNEEMSVAYFDKELNYYTGEHQYVVKLVFEPSALSGN